MTLTPGLHFDVEASRYHADPAEHPSLSSSVAKIIIEKSPLHAWHAHPRLGLLENDAESDPTRPKEIGTAVHKLILGRGAEVLILPAEDFKKQATRDARAEAYAAGYAPILEPDAKKAATMSEAFERQIARIPGCEGFLDARTEVVAIVKDVTGAHLRCMVDALEIHDTHAVIWDVKTGDQSGAPQGVGRRIGNMDFDLSAAFYIRVLAQLLPHLAGRIIFRWAFIENDAPHLLTVVELDNTGLEIGKKKASAAIRIWNRCRETNVWPGYPSKIITAEYPAYSESAWCTREEFDPALNSLPLDPFFTTKPRVTGNLSEIAS